MWKKVCSWEYRLTSPRSMCSSGNPCGQWISLVSPSGVRVGPIQDILGSQRFILGNRYFYIMGNRNRTASNRKYLLTSCRGIRIYTAARWQIILSPRRVVTGTDESMWLPSQSALNIGTGFLFPKSDTTLTIPSTALRVITVGAYNGLTFSYAGFGP